MNIQTLQELKSRKSLILRHLRLNPFGENEKYLKELTEIDKVITSGKPTLEDLYPTIAPSFEP